MYRLSALITTLCLVSTNASAFTVREQIEASPPSASLSVISFDANLQLRFDGAHPTAESKKLSYLLFYQAGALLVVSNQTGALVEKVTIASNDPMWKKVDRWLVKSGFQAVPGGAIDGARGWGLLWEQSNATFWVQRDGIRSALFAARNFVGVTYNQGPRIDTIDHGQHHEGRHWGYSAGQVLLLLDLDAKNRTVGWHAHYLPLVRFDADRRLSFEDLSPVALSRSAGLAAFYQAGALHYVALKSGELVDKVAVPPGDPRWRQIDRELRERQFAPAYVSYVESRSPGGAVLDAHAPRPYYLDAEGLFTKQRGAVGPHSRGRRLTAKTSGVHRCTRHFALVDNAFILLLDKDEEGACESWHSYVVRDD